MEALHPAAQVAAIVMLGLCGIAFVGFYAVIVTGRWPWERATKGRRYLVGERGPELFTTIKTTTKQEKKPDDTK